LYFGEDETNDFIYGKEIGFDDKISMVAGMAQPEKLFLIFSKCPIKIAAGKSVGVGNFEVNQKIGMSQSLPHICHIRMFLRDMAAVVSKCCQVLDEGSFSRSANPDNPDQRRAV
jgi:hypothetical protein